MSDLAQLDLATLSAHLAARRLTTGELVEFCHRRIERLNPSLNAFREIDIARARECAKVCDARETRLGPLDGIPIAVKDNIDIEGLITRSGLGSRDETPAQQDADIVRRLRAAGAIILGHANMHEGALGATNDNPHVGKTHNPWRMNYTPGGSSGGSAAAVAAGLCPLALGTDTMGSIRLPAAYCGVAGYKPSHGLIGNAGIEPLRGDMDQVGPIARSAADLRLWFEVTTNVWSDAREIDLRSLRFSLLANIDAVDLSSDVRAAFENVIGLLHRSGVETPTASLEGYDPGKARRAGLLLVEAEAAEHFRDDRARYPSAFSPAFAALLDYGAHADDDRIANARMTVADVRKRFDALFEDVDLLLLPTAPQVAFCFDDAVPLNQADLTALANFAGAPAVSMPIGLDRRGLPIGLQMIGARGADGTVLAAAAALENAIAFQRPDLPAGDWS